MTKFKIDTSFLEEDPASWDLIDTYSHGKNIVDQLQVTNDVAERGVALFPEFTSNERTKDEDQLVAMVQVFKEHQILYPNANFGLGKNSPSQVC